MNRYQKAIRYTKPLVEIDEKIRHLNERMTTTGMYTVTNQDDGIEEVPPTFEPAPLGDFSDLDNFSWNDQGDGSSATANVNQLKLMRVNYVMNEYDPTDKEVKNKRIKSNKKSIGRFFKAEKKADTSRTRWLKG